MLTSVVFEHNFEVNAFMYDVETALEMKEIFLQDQRESTQIFLKNWVKRSWMREGSRVCRSFVGSAALKRMLPLSDILLSYLKSEKFTLP